MIFRKQSGDIVVIDRRKFSSDIQFFKRVVNIKLNDNYGKINGIVVIRATPDSKKV